jgi:tRNA dimethylallyltransferase
MTSTFDLVAVIGPTASGKTSFAAHLAFRINGEIISADSRQVYRRMNQGTGKDYADYIVENKQIPVHLIDIAEPGYKYSIFEYQRDFISAFKDITRRGKLPVLCGGSGMYIDAATRHYRLDEVPVNHELRKELSQRTLSELTEILSEMKVLHNNTDTDTIEHALRAIEIEKHTIENPVVYHSLPKMNTIYIGVLYEREEERQRITKRLNERIENGMIEEVKGLLDSGIPAESLTYYGLEYRYITLYIQGIIDFRTMKDKLNIAIHQFAKRQRTWFRKMEREGCIIHWIMGELPMSEKIERAVQLIEAGR